ncbi:MAG: type II secretion system F family protein [Caldilinea sp.]|nr:type II secretion system F family protein [Caldilineaceae bacterium]MCW5840317.1 type II secretion system F family protein [Caldilinea sp.]HRW46378.1 type II secretion system F family protein [Caldilinea sp.]
MTLFIAMRSMLPQGDPIEDRLKEFGLTEYVRQGNRAQANNEHKERFQGLEKLAHGFGFGEKLQTMLVRADVPMSTGEFLAILLAVAGGGFLLGAWRAGLLIGIVVAAALMILPIFYLKQRQAKRRNAFTNQLPDVLTLLVGSLRAGYGLSQALELVAREVPEPAAKEFQRVMRGMSLGLPMHRALEGMADRVESDDLDLVVTAINVQYEMGGNLSTVLENISETIRQRVRVLREVRVLTAQQRLTGNILAGMPILLAVALSVISPGYFDAFFEEGWVRMLPLGAAVMMVLGFVFIRKIVNIKV